MGIHQKGKVPIKNQQKVLFRNCTICYREMFRTYCPRQLWSYGYPYIAKITQLTASHAGRLQGRTSLELMTGKTTDISEYLYFGWYVRVWFKEDAGLRET